MPGRRPCTQKWRVRVVWESYDQFCTSLRRAAEDLVVTPETFDDLGRGWLVVIEPPPKKPRPTCKRCGAVIPAHGEAQHIMSGYGGWRRCCSLNCEEALQMQQAEADCKAKHTPSSSAGFAAK
eukprot:2944950-Prymnesium_polylepis.1